MFCLSKCGVECIYVFRIDKSQERPNVADWPQGGTDRPSEGHPSSSSAPKPGRTVGFGSSRAWDPGESNQERALFTTGYLSRRIPLSSECNSPGFAIQTVSYCFPFYLSLFIRCGCIQPLGLHNNISALHLN